SQLVGGQDFNNDGRTDLIGRKTDGTLWFYAGTGTGTVTGATKIGSSGWTTFDLLIGAGDHTGDGRADLLTRKPDGTLWLYAGTGTVNGTTSSVQPGRQISTGWAGYADLVSASDFNKDGRADLAGFKSDSSLWYFAGSGATDPGYKPAARIAATGWQDYTAVLSPGDFNRDGTKDLIGRKKDGTLWFFNGNGKSGYGTALQIGTSGWNVYTQVLAPGDFNNDGKPDLLARHTNGTLWFYAGTGTINTTNEGYKPAKRIGNGGWQNFEQIITPGDYNSDGKPDLLGRKTDGTLWFWPGTGTINTTNEGYGRALKIGTSGWQNFDHVITPGDFNGDKRND
ncbi:FG-GAP-like repeat-containing protein, partial [Arthrobacter sp. H5]|uniref:FG-GAP-like repeat-containing protein n=1 Tax=Arthrobacter sp. H5 TaxID=1267973 RepID=UPI00047F7DEC